MTTAPDCSTEGLPKFTPGERVVIRSKDVFPAVIVSGEATIAIDFENEADAHLDAAAPALYAAAVDARRELNCLIHQAAARGYTSGGPMRVVEKLTAAIQMATGKSEVDA